VAVRRRKKEVAAGWNARLAGLVLCAFFVLGMLTGFSATGRALITRASTLLANLERHFDLNSAAGRSAIDTVSIELDLLRSRFGAGHVRTTVAVRHDPAESAIAVVERHDGFYDLFADGALTGPVSPGRGGDLPILSGAAIETASGSDLIDYAARLVRSESQLSRIVSEMTVDEDRVASLFFEGSHTVLTFDLDGAQQEIDRAGRIFDKWQGREYAIVAIDMTTADQAVVRLQTALAPVKNVSRERGVLR